MKLSYVDILGDGERHTINAEITTEHSLSSYGQPVLLVDGQPLNAESWVLMAYQVVKATPEELDMLKQWVSTVMFLLGIDTSNAAAALGRSKSEKKTKAARENAKKGGWKKGVPRKPKGNGAH